MNAIKRRKMIKDTIGTLVIISCMVVAVSMFIVEYNNQYKNFNYKSCKIKIDKSHYNDAWMYSKINGNVVQLPPEGFYRTYIYGPCK